MTHSRISSMTLAMAAAIALIGCGQKEEAKPAAVPTSVTPVTNAANNPPVPPVRPSKSPIQKPIAPRANNITPLKAIKPSTTNEDSSDTPKLPPNVHLPDKVEKAPSMPMPQLPEPQILEQLY